MDPKFQVKAMTLELAARLLGASAAPSAIVEAAKLFYDYIIEGETTNV